MKLKNFLQIHNTYIFRVQISTMNDISFYTTIYKSGYHKLASILTKLVKFRLAKAKANNLDTKKVLSFSCQMMLRVTFMDSMYIPIYFLWNIYALPLNLDVTNQQAKVFKKGLRLVHLDRILPPYESNTRSCTLKGVYIPRLACHTWPIPLCISTKHIRT